MTERFEMRVVAMATGQLIAVQRACHDDADGFGSGTDGHQHGVIWQLLRQYGRYAAQQQLAVTRMQADTGITFHQFAEQAGFIQRQLQADDWVLLGNAFLVNQSQAGLVTVGQPQGGKWHGQPQPDAMEQAGDQAVPVAKTAGILFHALLQSCQVVSG